eukprot:scaffold3367_cov52-Phaeocystis_antarctica.AAC.2
MVKGGEIGDFGGGSLEHPRQWLGAQWRGLTLGVPSCPEPPGAPLGGTGAELGHRQGGTLTMLLLLELEAQVARLRRRRGRRGRGAPLAARRRRQLGAPPLGPACQRRRTLGRGKDSAEARTRQRQGLGRGRAGHAAGRAEIAAEGGTPPSQPAAKHGFARPRKGGPRPAARGPLGLLVVDRGERSHRLLLVARRSRRFGWRRHGCRLLLCCRGRGSRARAASGLLAGRAERRGGRRGLGDALLALSLQLALVGEVEGSLLTNEQPRYSGSQQRPQAAYEPSHDNQRKDRDRVRLKPTAAAAGAPGAHGHRGVGGATTWQSPCSWRRRHLTALAAWRKARESTNRDPYEPLPPSPPSPPVVMTLWPQPTEFEHSEPSSSSSESLMWEEVVQCGRSCPYAYDGDCDDGGSVCRAASNPRRPPLRLRRRLTA